MKSMEACRHLRKERNRYRKAIESVIKAYDTRHLTLTEAVIILEEALKLEREAIK